MTAFDPSPELTLPAKPTNGDLANAIVELDNRSNNGLKQVHDCLEDYKTEANIQFGLAARARDKLLKNQITLEDKVNLLTSNQIALTAALGIKPAQKNDDVPVVQRKPVALMTQWEILWKGASVVVAAGGIWRFLAFSWPHVAEYLLALGHFYAK